MSSSESLEGGDLAVPAERRRGTGRWRSNVAALSRRDRVDLGLSAIAWAALIAWVCLVVAPGLLPGKVFLGTDRTNDFSPWSINYASVDHGAVNGGIADTIDSATPMAILISDSARSGHFPLWDPYTSGGTVLAAIPNSGLLSPLSLPWWILPHHAANAGVKIMEILAIALGMQLLLRRQWRLPRFTVPIAALTFACSGFMVAWTNWPQTRVAALLPLLFWAVDRLAVDPRWRSIVPMALIVASMLLGGFPTVLAYGMYTAIPYYLVRAIGARMRWSDVGMGVVRSGAGTALGVGLAAIQMVPFLHFSRTYVNFGLRDGFVGAFLPTTSLASAVEPFLLGYPNGTHNTWPIHYVEGFSYVGSAAIVFVCLALLIRPRREHPRGVLWFLVAALLALASATYWGGPLLITLQHLPALGTSFFGRMRSVLGLLVALLMALGMAAVFDAEGLGPQLRRLRTVGWRAWINLVVRVGLVALITKTLLEVLIAAQNTKEYQYSRMWTAFAMLLVIAVLVGALVVWITPSRLSAAFVMVVTVACVFYPALDVARNWWPLSNSNTFYRQTSAHVYLEEHLGQERYITVGQAMLPGSSSAYQLRSATGHAFTTHEYQVLMAAVNPKTNFSVTYSSLPTGAIMDGLDSGILDRLGVKYVVAPSDEEFKGVAEDGGTTVGTTKLVAGKTVRTQSITGPVRGVQLTASDYAGLGNDNGVLHATIVRDSDGSVLGTSEYRLGGSPGRDGMIAVAGEDIPKGTSWHLELTISDTVSWLELGVTSDGDATAGTVRAADDGLKLVHAGDALIFERLSVGQRIRWSSSELAIEKENERVAALEAGEISLDTAVLEDKSELKGLKGGTTATVTSKDITTDHIEISAKSTGPGWVVIDDPLRDGGWHVTADGKSESLVDVDNAGVAVYVGSAGAHTIEVTYSAPGFKAGEIITAISWILLLAVLVTPFVLRRRRSRAPMAATDGPVLEASAGEVAASGETAPDRGEARRTSRRAADDGPLE